MTVSFFFYGSLMSRRVRQTVVHEQELECQEARLRRYKRFKVSGQHFPGVVAVEESECFVDGIICTYSEETGFNVIRALDRFEDEGNLYKRERVQVELLEPKGCLMNDNVSAWIYVWLGKISNEPWDYKTFLQNEDAFLRQEHSH